VSAGARALELLLGTESGCVRDIITEELAKGLDAYWRISADDALDAARAGLVSVLGVSSWFGTFPGIDYHIVGMMKRCPRLCLP